MATNTYNEAQRQLAKVRAERYAGMRAKGMSLSQIATEEGISRQAVTHVLRRFGLLKSKAVS